MSTLSSTVTARNRRNSWHVASLCIAALVVLPILVPFFAWLTPEAEVWRHLTDTVLGELLYNTLVLSLGVGIGVLVLGAGLAWLTTLCEFPGRRLFEWALMLPLAIPTYVLAFVAIGLLDFSGPLQTSLRAIFGEDLRLPQIRSTGGVITVMVLALYPYVYMLARTAFLSQGRTMMECGRMLGLTPWQAFLRVALPTARPALAAGVALALMETLADFGAVYIFNYDTFTTAIYKAWFGLFSLEAAAQLSTLLLLLVALALYLERRFRGAARYYNSGKPAHERRLQLTGARAWGATAAAATVLLVAFLIPLGQLLLWAGESALGDLDARYAEFVLHTLTLGALAALITVSVALLLAAVRRLQPQNRLSDMLLRLSTLGYALPGTVLAVGIMLLLTWLDQGIDSLSEAWFGAPAGLALASSLVALLFAYLVRFLAVAHSPVDSGLERITPSIAQAARSLGAAHKEILWRIYLPMLRPGLLSAALLVLVEVMKELPATLLLRPFGWDTLAVRIFELTSEGEWERAALPALALVLVGLVPVRLLMRATRTQTS